MDNLRIAIVLGSKFPSTKAYSVTTRETLNALLGLKCDVKVFCQRSAYSDSDFRFFLKLISNFSVSAFSQSLIKVSEKMPRRIRQITWNLGIALMLVSNIGKIKRFNPDVIWVRDALVGIVIKFFMPKTKMVCEIHSPNSKLIYKMLFKFESKPYCFAINLKNLLFIKSLSKSSKTFLAPMSIRSSSQPDKIEIGDFVSRIQKKSHRLKIGYVGNFSPQGYSKGIEDLIDLAKVYKQEGSKHSIILIGATSLEKKILTNRINQLGLSSKNIEIKCHISHTKALGSMRKLDVCVLPMPTINSNYSGMPLKLLEYLAAGRITVIADSRIIKEILFKGYSPYYYSLGNASSLKLAIERALSDKKLKSRIAKGVEFASKFTWEERTKNILKQLS
jgi:glycosyltransferase involved in cell wall biosynthesis